MTEPIYDDIVRASLKIIGAALSRVSFSLVICIEQRHVETVRNYRSSAPHRAPHRLRALPLAWEREETFVPEDEAPKARGIKSVWWNIIISKRKKKKREKIGKKNSRHGMTRCEFALWRRSYRRITTDYLAGRLRFQIGIRIANASVGKVLWTYCRRGMIEGDARGVAQKRSTVHRDWSKCSFGNDARQQSLSRFIYLILIGKSFDRASWIESMAHLSLVHNRSLPMTYVNLSDNYLQLSLYV